MGRSIIEMTFHEAISAANIQSVRTLRLELKLDAASHPLLMRHLETRQKKMLAATILALAERGVRAFYFPEAHIPERTYETETSGFKKSPTSDDSKDAVMTANMKSTKSEKLRHTQEIGVDWIDDASINALLQFSSTSK